MMSRLICENLRKSYCIFFELFPLQIWTLKICNHDISESITARGFKLGLLIGDEEYINWRKLKKKKIIFSELSPFADLDFENL